ncbi:unnamed protein product [Callosobruchus maculatus]|uniref:Uncharacterized protein n=1 Tax=Callosobruchus maculatus TaxID=64391 RepID=A0A653D4E5_CALMS|nr:unnamed protein product [Callosobruchus maculatus]
MKNREDICMPITMKILRFHKIFPPKGASKDRNYALYVKASLLLLYGSVILIGSSLHLAKAAAMAPITT